MLVSVMSIFSFLHDAFDTRTPHIRMKSCNLVINLDLSVCQRRQELAISERSAIYKLYRSYIGHIWLHISHVQPTVQATDGPYPYPENWGGSQRPPTPHFLHIHYGPAVACTVDWRWLMYSLCMAHIWLMYELYVALSEALREALRQALRKVLRCYY